MPPAGGGTWTRAFLEGEHDKNYFGFTVSDDAKTILYNYSMASQPGQWYRAQLEGAKVSGAAQLTELNPQYKNKAFAKSMESFLMSANEQNLDRLAAEVAKE